MYNYVYLSEQGLVPVELIVLKIAEHLPLLTTPIWPIQITPPNVAHFAVPSNEFLSHPSPTSSLYSVDFIRILSFYLYQLLGGKLIFIFSFPHSLLYSSFATLHSFLSNHSILTFFFNFRIVNEMRSLLFARWLPLMWFFVSQCMSDWSLYLWL